MKVRKKCRFSVLEMVNFKFSFRTIQKAFRKYFSQQKLLRQREEASGTGNTSSNFHHQMAGLVFFVFRHFLQEEREARTFPESELLLGLHWPRS
jgi:hypothetical protein